MKNFVGKRLQQFTTPSSMGVVIDARYVRCFWPYLDEPTVLFAEGSRGIRVMGPPTPRNVVFPDDTIFEECAVDAVYPAEQALRIVYPRLLGVVELTTDQADLYLREYDEAASKLPPTASKARTKNDVFAIRERRGNRKDQKIFSASLTREEAVDFAQGRINRAQLLSQKELRAEDGEILERGR